MFIMNVVMLRINVVMLTMDVVMLVMNVTMLVKLNLLHQFQQPPQNSF
ncbi:hypothetical protein VB740_10590 [Nostoc sp. UHCC 0251]|nr:hypothetical protein [Nostoc sp. UHCC 0251]